jgi:hypothetical protein
MPKGGRIPFVILGLDDSSDTGVSQSDDLTKLSTGFTLTGTIDPSIGSFAIFINGETYTVPDSAIDSDGNWTFFYGDLILADGTILVEASYTTIHPKSGNEQTKSAKSYSFVLDSSTETPEIASANQDPGGVQLTGTAEAGATVTIYRDEIPIDATTADGNGDWQFLDGFGGGSATYKVVTEDAAGNSAESVTFDYSTDPGNTPPDAIDDSAVIDEDTDVTIPVLTNDSDLDSDPLNVDSVTTASNGSVTLNPDGTITYTPDANWSGQDNFTYTISDGNGGTDTATVTVTVNPVNDAPIALDDGVTTDEDTAIVFNVLTNDDDIEGNSLTLVSVLVPANGSASFSADVTITYTPDPDFYGTETFDYMVGDGTDTSTATVTITVDPVNDAPIAQDDGATPPRTPPRPSTFLPMTMMSTATL